MGCDIHDYVELRRDGVWQFAAADMLDWRNYGWFGFLADVRNYSHSPVIASPRGLPADVTATVAERHERWGSDAHGASWLTLAELLAYDYDQVFWDRRILKGGNGAALAEVGEGVHVSLREFLGDGFLASLQRIGELDSTVSPQDVRVVFWFDN